MVYLEQISDTARKYKKGGRPRSGKSYILMDADDICTLIFMSCGLGTCKGVPVGVYTGCPGMTNGRFGAACVAGAAPAPGNRPRALSEAINGFSLSGSAGAGCVVGTGGAEATG